MTVSEPEDHLPPTPYGFRQLGYDTRYLLKRPFHLDRRSKKGVAMASGVTVGLYLFRDEIRDWSQDHRSPGRERFLDGVRSMGKGSFAPALALIAYTSSLVTGKEREKETALLLLESMAFSAMAAGAGSFVLATERPEDGDAVRLFHSDGHGVSVDAALAASVVPPLRRQYLRVKPADSRGKRFWKRTGTLLLYSGAVLTAYQRIDRDQHWAPEAFLGTMVGLAVGSTLCRAHDEVRAQRSTSTSQGQGDTPSR